MLTSSIACGILHRPPVWRLYFTRLKKGPLINNEIRATELRVVDENGENAGVLSKEAALALAHEKGLDLIEIAPNAKPPIAKIMEYGKYLYLEQKKERAARAGHKTETKSLQIKIGTGEHDLLLKSQKASEFLKEGHRVKIELYLSGRAKYFNEEFQKVRLQRILDRIEEPYKISQGPERGPKGLSVIIEKDKNKK